MYLHSVAAYADKIVDELDKDSVECLRSLPKERLWSLHHSWGMAIRNKFGLWKADHPLTKNWHTRPEAHLIRDGVDYSEDHPDAISMKIMKRVWEKVNAE